MDSGGPRLVGHTDLSIWPHIAHFVKRAVDRQDYHTLGEIYQGLTEHRYQLWTVDDPEPVCALITATQYDDDAFYCLLLALGGDGFNRWGYSGIRGVERWAKEKGCTEMRIYGRKGWARKLGYKLVGMDGDLYEIRKSLYGRF